MRRLPALASAGLLAATWLAPSPQPAAADDEPATDVDPALEGVLSPWIQADADLDTQSHASEAITAPAPSTRAMLSVQESNLPVPAPTGPVLLSGQVTAATPAPGQLTVYLADEQDADFGVITAPSPIATADIGTNGTFLVNPAVEGRIQAAMDDSGRVNLMVTGTFGGRAFLTNLVRQYDASQSRWTTTDESADLSISLVADIPLEATPDGTRSLRQYVGCTDSIARSYQVTSIVGEAQLSQRFAGGTFKYTGGKDSELGIAVQNGSGPWRAGGSTSVSKQSSVSNEFPLGPNEHRVIYGNFQYHDIKTTCSTGYSVYSSTVAKPYAWNGGVWPGPTTTERYCGGRQTQWRQPLAAGAVFVRDKTKAQTWSGGVTVHSVGLTTRAGYSTSVAQTWKAGKQPTWVCGSNAFPNASKRVFTSSSIR